MANVDEYEILVLGSGGSGKFIAWNMAKAGHRTAMVERGALGGACPNVACLPSKNMIYSARVASLAKRGSEFGIEMDSLRINMASAQRRKREMVAGLHQMHVDLTVASGAELIMGEGRFADARTVEVKLKGGGSRHVTGRRIFLDLGSHATIPSIPGLAAAQPMSHVEALDLDRLPAHLIVLGGGYVGLELAQAMRRFGSQVTLIEAGQQLAGREDPDIATALLNLFQDEGIEVLLGTEIHKVEGRSGEKVEVRAIRAGHELAVTGTDLLVATGRKANTDGIGLERAGIQLDEHGYIKVNERLETTVPNIWAMGDCAGSPQFTHVAFDDFRVVYDNLNGGKRTTKNRLVPFCMFTDPELARVGLNESEAKHNGIEYRLVTMPMSAVLRTRTVSEQRGLMKMLIAKKSDEVLGFTAFGFEASEMMVAVQTAMIGHLPYTVLRDAIFTHPTMSEGLNELLGQVKDF